MIHFISDLHLSPKTKNTTRIFLQYLGRNARSVKQLFILGDLFEIWLGDDCINDPEESFNRKIVEVLRSLSDSGVKIFVMHGNRDFLLGSEFSSLCGATLLSDPHILSLEGWQFVLSHGDALCTDDKDYQEFRRQVRAPIWKTSFLKKPLPERQAIATALRQQSEDSKREKQEKSQFIMDVRPDATDNFLRNNGYATFIHGHTHHPATHDHIIDGIHVERWVLSDWHENRGEVVSWDGEKLSRFVLRLTANCTDIES